MTTEERTAPWGRENLKAGNSVRVPALQTVALEPLPDEPLVSILVTNFNYGRFVAEALESTLDQTYERIEIIVCDDGSTDDSCTIIERFGAQDERVNLLRKSNGGQASAFNAAYAASKGELICFLDADDMFLPRKVERCVESLRSGDSGLLIHQMMVVDASKREVQRIPTFTAFESGWIADKVIDRGGRWRWMPASAICMRREVLDRLFPVPEPRFRTDADTFLLMLAPLITKIDSLAELLALYRLHGSNAYGGRRMDERSVARTVEALSAGIDEVNKRLIELDASEIQIDPSNNLKLTEQYFLQAAFDRTTPRARVLREYLALVRQIFGDDLYSSVQKSWATLMFGVTALLPARLRPGWASLNLGTSRLREIARRIQQRELRAERHGGNRPSRLGGGRN